jgi:hypothetical protein
MEIPNLLQLESETVRLRSAATKVIFGVYDRLLNKIGKFRAGVLGSESRVR